MGKPEDNQQAPLCPNCNEPLTGTGIYFWRHAAAMIACVFCISCRKPLSFDTFPMAMPQQQPSNILRPD